MQAAIWSVVLSFLNWSTRQAFKWSMNVDHAHTARTITKERVLAYEKKAQQTPTDLDDTTSNAAVEYFGFSTMRKAQKKISEALVAPELSENVRLILVDALKILDESEA